MPTLTNLKKVCAAYHKQATSALTVDGVDLFLIALNNAKDNAQLLCNFELSRVRATLAIDLVTGGALSDAVISSAGDETVLTLTGSTTPAWAEVYYLSGQINGYDFYAKQDEPSSPFIYYDEGQASYLVGATIPYVSNGFIPAAPRTTVEGTFVGAGTSTGTLTGALTPGNPFTELKEIIAVMRTNIDGVLMPLDFTRSDIPIERDRYELEMSEDFAPSWRYPSDASLLQRGSNGSIIQRGERLFVYPLDSSESDDLSVTLEAYGRLGDYTASHLAGTVAPDFLVKHGSTYLQWAVICELNFYFKTFVPRTEGNLSPPEQKKEEAWRDLLLWNEYLIDPNSSRSR